MATNETIFTHSAQAALRLLPKIHAATAQMLYAHEKDQLEDANQLAFDAERQVEKLVNSYRMIPTFLGSPSARMEVEKIISEEIPVEIGFTDEGWFSLRIPRLLPRKERGKGSHDYIRGYLYPAMQRFFQNEYPVRFDDCVIIYRHIYDRNEPERQFRDHDNIELNFVTDTVALFVMTDDAPLRCRHYYCSAAGQTERTEVYVVPATDFIKWFEAEKTFPEEGVKLHAQNTFWQEKDVPKQG